MELRDTTVRSQVDVGRVFARSVSYDQESSGVLGQWFGSAELCSGRLERCRYAS